MTLLMNIILVQVSFSLMIHMGTCFSKKPTEEWLKLCTIKPLIMERHGMDQQISIVVHQNTDLEVLVVGMINGPQIILDLRSILLVIQYLMMKWFTIFWMLLMIQQVVHGREYYHQLGIIMLLMEVVR